ncbi:MAG: hypothetical protein AB7V46_12305 [Thermomicrobiales bacterium]
MDQMVAKTIVFDREMAIRAREMNRIAAEGQDRQGRFEGIVGRVARLVQFRQQAPVSLQECGGAAA